MEMATHSSVLAWRIPGMAEPGGLLSMGSHRVGHDWSDLAAAAAAGVLSYIVLGQMTAKATTRLIWAPCQFPGKKKKNTARPISQILEICHWGFCLRLASLVAQRVKHLPTTWETRVRSLGWEDPLEKEMATHSSTLAWKIPWTEKPGRLQSMGSQRVRHDWATSLHYVE